MPRRSKLCYVKVSLRRLGRPARIHQSICKSAFEIDKLSVSSGREFERPAIKGRGSFKSERARCFFGSHASMSRRAHSLTRSQIVFKQCFGIVDAAAFECLGHPAVNLSNPFRRELAGEGFANAIVVELERVSGSAGAQKLGGTQGCD